MEYFYITSSIASLLGFLVSILILYRQKNSRNLAKFSLMFFLVLTIFFWIWFYFLPVNPAKNIIAERSVLVNTYINGEKYIDIVEGTIEFYELGSKSILLPPFKSRPEIIFIYLEGSSPYDPRIIELTKDKIVAKVDNDAQLGKWQYRAKGEILRKVER